MSFGDCSQCGTLKIRSISAFVPVVGFSWRPPPFIVQSAEVLMPPTCTCQGYLNVVCQNQPANYCGFDDYSQAIATAYTNPANQTFNVDPDTGRFSNCGILPDSTLQLPLDLCGTVGKLNTFINYANRAEALEAASEPIGSLLWGQHIIIVPINDTTNGGQGMCGESPIFTGEYSTQIVDFTATPDFIPSWLTGNVQAGACLVRGISGYTGAAPGPQGPGGAWQASHIQIQINGLKSCILEPGSACQGPNAIGVLQDGAYTQFTPCNGSAQNIIDIPVPVPCGAVGVWVKYCAACGGAVYPDFPPMGCGS